MTKCEARAKLSEALSIGIAAAQPTNTLARLNLDPMKNANTLVAAGKSAAQMARYWLNNVGAPDNSLIVTRYGYAGDVSDFPAKAGMIFAGHPTPDLNSQKAGDAAYRLASGCQQDDHIIFLLSGGASSLLSTPIDGVSFKDLQSVTRQLLMSGCNIKKLNTVRKHLTRLGGGGFAAAAYPARIDTLIVSDVVGDQPSDIASGPCSADPHTLDDALTVLKDYNIDATTAVRKALGNPANETLKPNAPILANANTQIICSASDSIAAISDYVSANGYAPEVISEGLEGEAREIGKDHATRALKALNQGRRCALISGGEATVTVRNHEGRGGPNTEFLLGFALAINNAPGVYAAACDSDGVDGTQDNAGGFVEPGLLRRVRSNNINPFSCLENNQAFDVFQSADALYSPGPTGTNVNDLRVVLIDPTHT